MARGVTERYMTKEVLIGGFLEEIMPKERYKVKKKLTTFSHKK